MIGTSIFNYKVEKLIGYGGFAIVYLGISDTGGKAAIKVLQEKYLFDPEIVRRFKSEVEILARFHASGFTVEAIGFDDRYNAFVMEYIEGCTLAQYINDTPHIGLVEVVRLFDKIAATVEFLHKHNIIHRDITPRNIMIRSNGEPVILDLGIAKDLTNESTLTTKNLAIGSLPYASPEQLDSLTLATKQSDIYSLGATFYFMLTRSPPYDTKKLSNEKIILEKSGKPFPKIPSEFKEVNEETQIKDVIKKTTERQPDKRYKDIGSLRKNIQKWLSEKESTEELEKTERIGSRSTTSVNWLLSISFALLSGVIGGFIGWGIRNSKALDEKENNQIYLQKKLEEDKKYMETADEYFRGGNYPAFAQTIIQTHHPFLIGNAHIILSHKMNDINETDDSVLIEQCKNALIILSDSLEVEIHKKLK